MQGGEGQQGRPEKLRSSPLSTLIMSSSHEPLLVVLLFEKPSQRLSLSQGQGKDTRHSVLSQAYNWALLYICSLQGFV